MHLLSSKFRLKIKQKTFSRSLKTPIMGRLPANAVINQTYYIVTWTKYACFTFIMLPFVIYCVYLMYKDRDRNYVKKRRPKLILQLIFWNLIIAICMYILHLYLFNHHKFICVCYHSIVSLKRKLTIDNYVTLRLW